MTTIRVSSCAFAILLLMAARANSQGLSIGIKGGMLYSDPTTSEGIPPGAYLELRSKHVTFGGILEIPLDDPVDLVVEPAFVRRSASMILPFFSTTFSEVFTADYLEIPVSLKMTFPWGPLQPYAIVGAGAAYKVTERHEFTVPGFTSSDMYSRYDVALHIGGGVSYPILPGMSALIDVRYVRGFNQANLSGPAGMKSSEFRGGVGILFSI